jgi:hypothetical protein
MKSIAALGVVLAALPAFSQGTAGFSFRAQLSGYQEVPSVSTTGRGTLDLELSGDYQVIHYVLSYSGLQGTVQQSHIHFAQPGVNGAIVVWLCGTTALPGPAGTPTCPQSGTVRGSFNATNVLATPTTQQLGAGELGALIQALRASAAYANVHTTNSPGGEIRGQIF